jgi:hypothetical protein
MFNLPDPVAMFEGAKNAGLEREIANAFVSAACSAFIAFMWRSGAAKWAGWSGEGQAMKDAATAYYLTLSRLETKHFLTLTVPTDMLSPGNLSNFQTEQIK